MRQQNSRTASAVVYGFPGVTEVVAGVFLILGQGTTPVLCTALVTNLLSLARFTYDECDSSKRSGTTPCNWQTWYGLSSIPGSMGSAALLLDSALLAAPFSSFPLLDGSSIAGGIFLAKGLCGLFAACAGNNDASAVSDDADQENRAHLLT